MGFAVTLIFVVLFALVVVWNWHQKVRDRFQCLAALAKQYNGRVEGAGWFDVPTVILPHNRGQIILTAHSAKEAPDFATIRAPFPERNFRCYIRRGEVHGFARFLGVQDIKIGSPEFDRRYLIQGAPEGVISGFLRPEVQRYFLSLDRHPNRPTTVRISGGVLEIHQDAAGGSYEALRDLMESFLHFYDVLFELPADAIAILDVNSGASRVGESTPCPVCGEGLAEEVVLCRRCRTPHHQDCWDYNGSCSTYGCGEKQSCRVQKKSAS